MTTAKPMDEWKDINWKAIERNVFKLQTRIYRASQRGDLKTVHKLQRLLTTSWSARLLAVRKVSQDNQGKKTAGIDGVKSLNPKQRLTLANSLQFQHKVKPVRRVWIPKPGTEEKRPLGIPVLADRARQTLTKFALEPQWEARFEPNSYGFRPGRSCHDAIEEIYIIINRKAKWVLEADIAKCFDRINHNALLQKLDTYPTLRRQIKAWLKAGVVDGDKLFPTSEGTPQGGVVSPLLANIALHGLESFITSQFPQNKDKGILRPKVVVYADDFVVLHDKLNVINRCQQLASEWLKSIGLELKPSKTRITHTLELPSETPGFEFLGFNIRQFPVGKTKSGIDAKGNLLGFKTIIRPSKQAIERHLQSLRQTIDRYKHLDQETLIKKLDPIIRGWSRYYSAVASKKSLGRVRVMLFQMLYAWAKRRHNNKGRRWVADKYWRITKVRGWVFQPTNSDVRLYQPDEISIQRHIKVKGTRSPYDGDWSYWTTRLGRYPGVSTAVAKLLKRQKGKCFECGMFFRMDDLLEIDHIIPKSLGGFDVYNNLQLLHRHCHDRKTARDIQSLT